MEGKEMTTPAPGPSSSPTTKMASTANEFIEQQLDERIRAIESAFGGAHAIGMNSQITFGVDDFLRNAVEKRHDKGPKNDKLIVILTTPGGYIEVVKRMVDTLRKFYVTVDFVVPNYAFSAARSSVCLETRSTWTTIRVSGQLIRKSKHQKGVRFPL
jgi:membrane-bound ClpP family serine protease